MIGVGIGFRRPRPPNRTAVFPHTALQLVVSSSRPSRCLPGRVKREQPGIREVGIGPSSMVSPIIADPRTSRLLAQHCPQAPSDHLIELEEDAWMGVLEVAEPASERPVEIDDDGLEALTSRPPCLRPDRLLQLVEALLAYVTATTLKPVAEELESVPLLPTVGDPCLCGLQRQTVFGHPRPDQRQGRFGFGMAPGEDDEVVRIPHHRVPAFGYQPV